MPEWLAVIILGVIEGITEFLPVSSTGHLLLAQHLDVGLPQQSDLFNVVIQCGAVCAVLLIFTERLKEFAFKWRHPEVQDYLLKLAVAFGITGVGGLALEIAGFQLPETAQPVAWALLVGGVAILWLEHWLKGKPLSDRVTWRVAIAVGVSQLVAAVFPGTSRSGATILAALLLGTNRAKAAEFSFLLGIPTLLAAGALKTLSAMKSGEGAEWDMLALGGIVAAVTAFVAVKWLLRFIQTHTFIGFGWYRIALGAAILAVEWAK